MIGLEFNGRKPILVLLASLDRPAAMTEAVGSLAVNGTGKFDVLTLSGNGGLTKALNSVPPELIVQYEVVGIWNDDTRMRTAGWDEFVLGKLRTRKGLVYGRDGYLNEEMPTHPFISTELVAAVGFIQPAQFYHYCGDTFWRDLLKPLGRLEYCPELFTEHLHVFGTPPDKTAEEESKHYDEDRALWRKFMVDELSTVRQRVEEKLNKLMEQGSDARE